MFIIGPRDTQEEINNQPATVDVALVKIGQVVEAGQRSKTLVSKYLKILVLQILPSPRTCPGQISINMLIVVW